MYLDVDGELVAFGLGRRALLAGRLLARHEDSKVGARLADDPSLPVVAILAEDFDEIREVLGLWHAEEGVLLDELGRLREAVGAAKTRRGLVARL
jgi:hypothetical protein